MFYSYVLYTNNSRIIPDYKSFMGVNLQEGILFFIIYRVFVSIYNNISLRSVLFLFLSLVIEYAKSIDSQYIFVIRLYSILFYNK